MTDFHHLSDRMPEAAAARARWSVEDELHLASCEACRREWELVRQAARLGAGRAARLDENAIATAVLDRLRAAPAGAASIAPGRRNWRLVGLAGAAAAALAAGLFMVIRGPTPSNQAPAMVAGRESTRTNEPIETGMLELPIPELEDIPPGALDTVLQALDRPFQADELLDSSWSDADSRELEHGLGTIRTPEG